MRSARFRLSRLQTTVCNLVSSHYVPSEANLSDFAELGTQEALRFATTHEVAPMVAHNMGRLEPKAFLPDLWCCAHDQTWTQVAAFLIELDQVAASLEAKGIPLVALKNGGIARGIYPCPGCCPMGDLDVLVERRDFRQAHAVLLAEGYHFAFRSPLEEAELATAEDSGGAEYWKILPSGEKLWFELQWRPVAGRWIRPDQEPPTEELMARSIPIPGSAVRLLAPEDNLLQVALHTAKHTYVRAPGFRLHLDVERIVQAYPNLDWDTFLGQVRELRVKTAVYFSLLIPHELFATPIPGYVLDTLRPPDWKERLVMAWLNGVGLFSPHEHKFGKLGYILFNALLYDDLRGLGRSLFPDPLWMQRRYGFQGRRLLPYYYGRRLVDLAFRRMNT